MRAFRGDADASLFDELRLFQPPLPPTSRAELGPLGVEIGWAWSKVGISPERELLSLPDVLLWSAIVTDPSLQEALALVGSHLDALGFSDLSSVKVKRDIGQFVSTLHLLDVGSLRDTTPEHAHTFLYGAVRGRHRRDDYREPSPSVVTWRRTAVRTLFMTARHLGLAESDPTLDIKVPPKNGTSRRALTTEEELLGRYASRMSFDDTRNPTIWALGQATAMPAEIGRGHVADVDLPARRVWLHGTKDRGARFGPLSDWGCEQLAARLDVLDHDPDAPLVYDGAGGLDRAASAVGVTMIEIFTIAGIRQPDLTPASLPAWRARERFNETGHIEAAAQLLGVTSLDRAAKMIGWRWGQ